LIAGEALCGLVVAAFRGVEKSRGHAILPEIFAKPSDWIGLVVFILIAILMVRLPLANAGSPDEPAPPTAIM
jgi:hypothetical protein